MKEFLFSAAEKYSLAFLQLLATLFMTNYFGMESLGMVASFTLITALATVVAEAGSSLVIMGAKQTEVQNRIHESFVITLVLGVTFYVVIFLCADYYSDKIVSTVDFGNTLRCYGLLVISAPLQIVGFSSLIKLEETKALASINLLAWLCAFGVLMLIHFLQLGDYRSVIWYFLVLSCIRAFLSWLRLHRALGLRILGIRFQEVRFRLSLISSQLCNTVAANIWTMLVAVHVSLEANAVLGLFNKLKDMGSGNLSHALHRVLYVRLANADGRRSAVTKVFSWFFFGNSILCLAIYCLKPIILEVFGGEYRSDLDPFIFFPLILGLIFPAFDFMKAILRFFNQTLVLGVEVLLCLGVGALFVLEVHPVDAFCTYLILSTVAGIIFTLNVFARA